MSLRIYVKKSDIPNGIKIVNYNDKFFNLVSLKNDSVTRDILLHIDRARYNSADTFIGRDETLGALNKSCLSTGSKTLLNIAYRADVCFDVIECGQNALRELVKIKEGIVLWECPVLLIHDAEECDIVINDRRFLNTMEFAEYIMEVLPGVV